MRQEAGPEVRFMAEPVEAPVVWLPLTDRAAGLLPFSRHETAVEAVAAAAVALDRALAPRYRSMSDPAHEFARAFLDVVAGLVPVTAGTVVVPLNGATEPVVVARIGDGVVTVFADLAVAAICDGAAAMVSPVSRAMAPESSNGGSVLYAPLSDRDVRMPLACVLVAALAGIARGANATCE